MFEATATEVFPSEPMHQEDDSQTIRALPTPPARRTKRKHALPTTPPLMMKKFRSLARALDLDPDLVMADCARQWIEMIRDSAQVDYLGT